MRLLGYTVQFWLIIFSIYSASTVLPQSVTTVFSLAAVILLCFSAALWIIELSQDCFFTSKVNAKNKAVLITGCDSGFGNAFAEILDKRGYTVFACCYDKLGDGAGRLKDTCSSRLKVIQLDVTKDESVKEAVETVEKNLDQSELWAVINNAGVLKGFQTELCSMKDYEDCLHVNTLGLIRVTKAFLPLLRRSKGRVINMCSMSGRFRSPFLGAYTVSKAAAVAFTEILRQEMREFGVRIISIEPEFFKTPMCSEKYLQNALDQSLDQVSDDIKSAYGTDYIEKAKQIYLSIFLNRSHEVRLVFDALEAAVSLENPSDIYKPCRNIFVWIMFFAGERVAVVFVELIVMITMWIMGLPKPKTGVNIFTRFSKM